MMVLDVHEFEGFRLDYRYVDSEESDAVCYSILIVIVVFAKLLKVVAPAAECCPRILVPPGLNLLVLLACANAEAVTMA